MISKGIPCLFIYIDDAAERIVLKKSELFGKGMSAKADPKVIGDNMMSVDQGPMIQIKKDHHFIS